MAHFLCDVLGHSRCARSVRPLAGGWISHCRRCGVRLVRVKRKVWLEHSAWTWPSAVIEPELPLFDREPA